MKNAWSIAISLLVTLVLGGLLLRATSWDELAAALAHLPVWTMVAALGGYATINLVRSVRIQFLLGQFTLRELFMITNVHNALVNLLPARTGELGYIVLLKRRGVAIGTSMGTLGAARVFDLFGIALIFFAASLITPLSVTLQQIRMPLLLAIGTVVLAVVGLLYFSRNVIHWFGGKNWLSARMREAVESVHQLRSAKRAGTVLCFAVIIWILQFSINTLVFHSLGIEISWAHSFLAASLSAVLGVLPVQGFVGFGTTEAIWVLALTGVGIAAGEAVAAGFVQHVVSILASVVLGFVGLLGLRQKQQHL